MSLAEQEERPLIHSRRGGGKHLKELAIVRQHQQQQLCMHSHDPLVSSNSDDGYNLSARGDDMSDEDAINQDKKTTGAASDPMSVLPEDLLCRITSFLNASSLATMRCINKSYYRVCSQNEAGWELLCDHVWSRKIHVSQAAAQNPNKMRAYQQAMEDASMRQHITAEELCSCVWSFRFKQSAGTDWTSADPWYQGLPCRKMVFCADGSVRQYREDGDSSTRVLFDPPVSMEWRFLNKPMDLPSRPWGSYLRFKVAGRDVPTYSVRRSPTNNWGFIMESCWGLYASFELPPRLQNDDTSASSGPRRRRRRRRLLRRTEDGRSLWVDTTAEGEEEDRSGIHSTRDGNEGNDFILQNDASLPITNEVQWREAFLYNVGARALPEGDDATDEFDRAWGGM